MVEQIGKRNNWKLGGTHEAIYEKFQVNVQVASIDRRSQSSRTVAQ
jgi:hypothetical protein